MRPSPIAVTPQPEGAAAAASRRSPARAAAEAQVCNAFVRRGDTPTCVGTAETRTEARFQLRKKLGQGSFGTVFEATDTAAERGAVGRKVAIKMLRDVYRTKHDALCALRELAIMRQCSHPCVIGNSPRRLRAQRAAGE